MALLAEYGVTPDVFDMTSYKSEEVCGLHLQALKEVLLNEGLVRDLRNGDWGRLFIGDGRAWHLRGKELLKKLANQKRLAVFPAVGAVAPTTDAGWCDEAIATHAQRALAGIIVSDTVGDAYKGNAIVSSTGRLSSAGWWAGRSPSLTLQRSLVAYRNALELVLRHANSIMLVDPHFDPSKGRYKDAVTLLLGAAGRAPAPLIEIHRVAWYGTGEDKRSQSALVEGALRPALEAASRQSALRFDVFLWDDFHDRYLISDLVGISVPNGFDTTTDARATTIWTRLGRADRDNVQREFDPASNRHTQRHRFTVG
jgi:hypothetical protein